MDRTQKEQIRYRIFEILEVRSGSDAAARAYDIPLSLS